jgi:hypothetical protein
VHRCACLCARVPARAMAVLRTTHCRLSLTLTPLLAAAAPPPPRPPGPPPPHATHHATVMSRPQLLAVLARVEDAAGRWDLVKQNTAGASQWEVLDFGSIVVQVSTARARLCACTRARTVPHTPEATRARALCRQHLLRAQPDATWPRLCCCRRRCARRCSPRTSVSTTTWTGFTRWLTRSSCPSCSSRGLRRAPLPPAALAAMTRRQQQRHQQQQQQHQHQR